MASVQLPIAVWRDASGLHTAALVDRSWVPGDGARLAGLHADADGAARELARQVAAMLRRHDLPAPPRLREVELLTVPVPVTPQEAGTPFLLRVPCVHARLRDGQWLVSLPLLGLQLRHAAGPANLATPVADAVQQHLRGCSWAELAALLPTPQFELRRVGVKVPGRRRAPPAPPSTEHLQQVADPVAGARRSRPRAWEREREVAALVELVGPRRASALVVGEPGAGKTLVIADALARLERGAHDRTQPAHPWSGRTAWRTSAARILAGMRYLGQWQGRLEQVLAELAAVRGLLVLDDLLELLVAGGGREDSVGAFLLPYVTQGQLQLVAECTPAERVACERLLPGLLGELVELRLPACDHAVALRILGRVAESARRSRDVEVAPGVPETLLDLTRRFLPRQALPGRAARLLLDLCGASAAPPAAAAPPASPRRITVADATQRFTLDSGLPEFVLRDDLPLSAAQVAAMLAAQVLGQPEACLAVAELVVTFKAGMTHPERPIGVLLFCGPTGVGKTALAQALATTLFGHGAASRLVRIDSSELADAPGGTRLLTTPEGQPSELVRRVRRHPFCVVLFDEIEKAGHQALDAMLSILDEGRATDELGRVTSFTSTIVILTSNLGGQATPAAGFGGAPRRDLEAALSEAFSPELRNRIDRVVRFTPLDRPTCRAILAKELEELSGRAGLKERDLKLELSPELVEHLATAGFDPRYGARHLQRVLDRLVVAPLARHLVAHPDLSDVTVRMELGEEGRGRVL